VTSSTLPICTRRNPAGIPDPNHPERRGRRDGPPQAGRLPGRPRRVRPGAGRRHASTRAVAGPSASPWSRRRSRPRAAACRWLPAAEPRWAEAIETGEAFRQAGADAVLLITPFYVKPTQAGCANTSRPTACGCACRCCSTTFRPAPTSRPIQTPSGPWSRRLDRRHEGVHPDVIHFNRVAAQLASRLAILSGEDTHFPLHMAMGARGGILATASLIPRPGSRSTGSRRPGGSAEAVAASSACATARCDLRRGQSGAAQAAMNLADCRPAPPWRPCARPPGAGRALACRAGGPEAPGARQAG